MKVAQSCPTLCKPHGLSPAILLHPWDSPGKSTRVGCHSLLQGIFLTQGLNLGLLHCRRILYHLSYWRTRLIFYTLLKVKQRSGFQVSLKRPSLLLLLLSRFSRVWLCADPIDGSPPGSPVPEILQARTLEWVAISSSSAWKWKGKVKSLSHVRLIATPWTAGHQSPLPMGFSRQEYWSGLPLPSLKMPLPLVKSPRCFKRKKHCKPSPLCLFFLSDPGLRGQWLRNHSKFLLSVDKDAQQTRILNLDRDRKIWVYFDCKEQCLFTCGRIMEWALCKTDSLTDF